MINPMISTRTRRNGVHPPLLLEVAPQPPLLQLLEADLLHVAVVELVEIGDRRGPQQLLQAVLVPPKFRRGQELMQVALAERQQRSRGHRLRQQRRSVGEGVCTALAAAPGTMGAPMMVAARLLLLLLLWRGAQAPRH
jgi:hypothetical protein